MKRLLYLSMAALMVLAVSCKKDDPGKDDVPEDDVPEVVVPDGAVDLGIVMTREDGTTYKLYWAKSNLSDTGLCTNPEDYGDYYAWGETGTKSEYSWSKYLFGTNSSGPFSKYNTNSFYGKVDDLTTLQTGPEGDDVASKLLGGKWRMPTEADWNELIAKCKWTWTTQNGVNGELITAGNGNSIFLPAGGFRTDSSQPSTGSFGDYWSSSLYTDDPSRGCLITFDSQNNYYGAGGIRSRGLSVRPVCEE